MQVDTEAFQDQASVSQRELLGGDALRVTKTDAWQSTHALADAEARALLGAGPRGATARPKCEGLRRPGDVGAPAVRARPGRGETRSNLHDVDLDEIVTHKVITCSTFDVCVQRHRMMVDNILA